MKGSEFIRAAIVATLSGAVIGFTTWLSKNQQTILDSIESNIRKYEVSETNS